MHYYFDFELLFLLLPNSTKIIMAEILSKWLNLDVQLSKEIGKWILISHSPSFNKAI